MFSNLQITQLLRTSKTRKVFLRVLNNLICSFVTGQPEVFKSPSGRIVILTSYLTSLVLMAAYSAFLISSLAVQHRNLPFRDLQGLLYDGSYRLGVARNSSHINILDVWGIHFLWPDYLVVVGLGWGDNMLRRENLPYESCIIRKLRQT